MPVQDDLLVRVPDWLSAEEVQLDAAFWERTHFFLVLPWSLLTSAAPLPQRTRVRVTIRGYPIDYCHPFYYRQATSSMGCLTAVDRECLDMQHRSFVRVILDCFDLNLIPHVLVLGHDSRWSVCPIELEVMAAAQPPLLCRHQIQTLTKGEACSKTSMRRMFFRMRRLRVGIKCFNSVFLSSGIRLRKQPRRRRC